MDGGDLHDNGDHGEGQKVGSGDGQCLWSISAKCQTNVEDRQSKVGEAEIEIIVDCPSEKRPSGERSSNDRSPSSKTSSFSHIQRPLASSVDVRSSGMKESERLFGRNVSEDSPLSAPPYCRETSSDIPSKNFLDFGVDDEPYDSSEFLDLPKRLSGRTSPLLLHGLQGLRGTSGCSPRGLESSLWSTYRTPGQRQNDWYLSSPALQDDCSGQSPTAGQDNARVDIDVTITSNVDIVVENPADDEDNQMYEKGRDEQEKEPHSTMSRLLLDNPGLPQGSGGCWSSLEPTTRTLLSPRSSNGSISSYRSSNADSAIDMLTPEEIHEGGVSEVNLQLDINLWNNRADGQDQGDVWDSAHDGESSPGTKDCDNNPSGTKSNCSWMTPLFQRRLRMDGSSGQDRDQGKPHFSLEDFDFGSLEPQQFTDSNPATPAVIISDYSTEPDLDETVEMHDKCSQTGDVAGDVAAMCRSETEGTEMNYLTSRRVSRSGSSSSLSSMESSLSLQSVESSLTLQSMDSSLSLQSMDSSLSLLSVDSSSLQSDSSLSVDDVSAERKKRLSRQSSWKKIRNMVHWTPFIQQFKRRKYPWIQLAGHQGNFQAGEPGAILKKFDSREHVAFTKLMKDRLRPYVPEYRGDCNKDSDRYLQLQDLLCEFEAPCVMDIKMGCRTYLEEELVKAREKPTLRKDMYKKMVEVDPSAPTEEENAQKAITKPRYMQWRDEMSSSVELGFRIEGIRKTEGSSLKNFKTTKSKSSIQEILHQFVGENAVVMKTYLRRLKAIRVTQEESEFFNSHEIIGSSLLFVHDKTGRASIWMIDFGKTVPLADSVRTDHRRTWLEGNHEDGYLTGMDSLIEIFEAMLASDSDSNSNSNSNDTSCPSDSLISSSTSNPDNRKAPVS